MTPAYIALGSNLQDPNSQLCKALAALDRFPGAHVEKVSSVYRSAAVGPGAQPDYLNAVVQISTALSPGDLLSALQQIERDQGRVRDVHWGPRTLDLDLLLYGDEQITSPELTVPHPAMHHRNFVLIPLREVCGTNLVLPNGTDIDTLTQHCPANGLVKTRMRLRANN